jgi:hypothetical protein
MTRISKLLDTVNENQWNVGDLVRLNPKMTKHHRLSDKANWGKIKHIYDSGLLQFDNQYGGTITARPNEIERHV